MKWPWRRRAHREGCAETDRQRREAETALAATEARELKVRRLANGLRRAREENDFAQLIADALRGIR